MLVGWMLVCMLTVCLTCLEAMSSHLPDSTLKPYWSSRCLGPAGCNVAGTMSHIITSCDTCNECSSLLQQCFYLQECQLTAPSSSMPFQPALEQPRAQGMGLLWLPWEHANALWAMMVQPVTPVPMDTKESAVFVNARSPVSRHRLPWRLHRAMIPRGYVHPPQPQQPQLHGMKTRCHNRLPSPTSIREQEQY